MGQMEDHIFGHTEQLIADHETPHGECIGEFLQVEFSWNFCVEEFQEIISSERRRLLEILQAAFLAAQFAVCNFESTQMYCSWLRVVAVCGLQNSNLEIR